MCNELVGTGDIDRDGNTGAARLGTGDRGHCAFSEALGFEGAIDRALGVCGGRCGGCVAHKGPWLFRGE